MLDFLGCIKSVTAGYILIQDMSSWMITSLILNLFLIVYTILAIDRIFLYLIVSISAKSRAAGYVRCSCQLHIYRVPKLNDLHEIEIGLRGRLHLRRSNESERWGWRRGMKKQGLAAERFGIHRTTTNGRFVKRDERVGFITRN